jgi:hypothetical protein
VPFGSGHRPHAHGAALSRVAPSAAGAGPLRAEYRRLVRDLLLSPAVLKLGFGFREDLRRLRSSSYHDANDADGTHPASDGTHPAADAEEAGRWGLSPGTSTTAVDAHDGSVEEGAATAQGVPNAEESGACAAQPTAPAPPTVPTLPDYAELVNFRDLQQSGGGLSAAIHAVLGKRLDKRMQTSDWGRRPLTADQVPRASTAGWAPLPSVFGTPLPRRFDALS